MTLTLLFSLVLGLSLKQQSVAGVLEDGSNGGPCLPNAICTDSNAECLNNMCDCIQGFVDVAGTCRMQGKIGGPCLPDANCTDENAVCSQNNVCTCIQDYVDVNGTCRLPGGLPGHSCTMNSDCLDENSFCFTGSCQCSEGYTPESNQCVLLQTDYTSTTSTTSTTSAVAQDETTNLPMTTATASFPVKGTPTPDPTDYTNTTSTTSAVAQDETTNPLMTTASTSSPAEGTPTPDPTGNCDTECLNGGSCVFDEKTANYWCDCAVGFTGLNCEIEVDFCAATPCPVGASCQSDYSNDQGFVCICQGDFKGPDCTEEDNLVVCQDFEETLYLELQPTAEDRKICLPKKKSVQGDICFDATEDLVYTARGIDDTLIRTADEPDQYCLEYYSDDPIAPKYCMTVTASEADDIQLRPWRKANATICFLFNRKPEFWAPTDVAYNLPDMAETEILDLSVSDPDSHQQLKFQIIAVSPQQYLDLFTVKTPGAIEVTKPSTIHTDPLNINVSLKIEDNGIPALSIEKILKVKFTDRQLLCVVTEDPIYIHFPAATRLPLQIGQINCAAQDTSITFSLQGDGDVSSAFSVDDSGLLYLNQNLEAGNYQVNVRAQIYHPITVVSQVSVKVVIGNMLPDCSVALLPFSVKENMPAGACSNTTYACLNPSGKPVGCSDDGLELFEMRCLPAEGKNILFRFCAMTSLQGEVGYYLLNVTLSNQYGESALDIEAIIENVNDRPIIDKTIKYAFNVEENLQVGESLATITVTDPDLLVDINPPENLTVEITAPLNTDESSQMYPFEVSLSQNQDYIELILSDPLDVKVTQNYVFNIQVSDLGGLSDNVLVTVIVEDVNEPPSCQQYSYDGITVSVKDKRDKMVVTLACSDDDLIPEFKNLFYEIQGDQVVKDHFSVDVNGVVTLIRPLTDIDESILNFTVVISDGVGSSVTVTITVIVSSDFPPECGDDVIPTSKSENMGETVCFTVNTGCVEPVNSLPLRYEIDSGNGTQLFKLNDEQTPNGISLCSKIKLKNKYGTWVLTGRAVSDFGATPITISISVTDINDPPTFELSLYEASVEENSKIGSAVIQVRATDPDSGAFGQVTYVSQGIESSEMFSLNPNDGWITVSGTVDADVPGPSEYRFIVEALNGGQPHNQPINATVLISVTDTNDNAPECQEPPASIPLYLLTPVDAIVYNLICSDTDKSPEYRQLRYKLSDITSQSGSETFAVDSNGVIRLAKALSRTIQRYRIVIVVQDSDDPVTALQANVDLDFAVNTTVPPRCTPAMINDTLPETKPKNFCLNNQVECIDITEGDKIGMGQPVGNGTKFLDIRTRTDKNKLFLSACVMNPIKDQFGTYQVEAAVSNGLAETEVIWTFTVTNVNEPPRFSFELYEASINETFSPGKIISLTVTDPDENTPEKTFHIAKVEAKLQNNEEFDGALADSITFFEVSRDFYVVVKNLNATERNQYIYLVTATDGKGLIATCTVVINITDVNEEPICTTSTTFEEIDILVPVGETISGVECFDNDLDTRNTELQYRITKGDPDGYFNMTLDGLITVAKPLPRTLLYNTGTASLEIVVEDRGIPPLSTTVTASIKVDIRIKPVCNPVITPPDRWYKGECLTVTMDCKDPTMPGSFGHLVFTLEGNYTSGFTDPQKIPAVFSLCYKLTESGVFEIVVRVDNDLSPFIFKEVVEVKYLQATPIFTSPSFTVAVSEFTKENQDILTANATSSELIGELLYNVIAAESTPRWSVYFSLDSKNGKITTKKELKELANTKMYLKLQVEDTGSKLKSSALAEINIEDENEAPSCTIADTDVNIDVDTDVEVSIISFNCSDPDVVANYKALSYSLTGSTNVNIYFKMMPETNPTSVVVKAPLSVTASSYDSRVDNSKSAYHVTIVVSDGGEPAKVYRKPFKIIVSLLPPAVTWSILELGYSHVFVTWEYDRSEYYQVTTSFQVKVKKPNIDDFVGTEEVKPDRRIYNTTGLEPHTTYEIFVSAITQYGTRDPPAQTIITAEIPRISIITATIKYATLNYDEQLRNSETDLHAETTKRVITSIEFVLKDLPGYVGVEVKSYRPGSLIVTTIISVNQSGNVENTKQLLADSVSSGYLGQLAVDKAYFVANIGGGYVLVDKIEISSDDLYNGTDISISCFVTTAGYELSEKFYFWWTYNENIIRPNSASRISTVSFSGAKFPELYMSIIEIKRASPKDSGTYACYVTDSEETSSSNKDINIDVLSQPIVTLTPRSLTVRSGAAVSIVCTLIEPLDKKETFQFQWYRNGSDLELQQGEEYNETTGTLTISSMTVTTIIGCRGRNEAGEGPLVQSHIGVIPTGPTAIICSETRDNRGTVWSEAVPGTVAIAPCPEGYKGEATRVCGADGKWKPPVYSCVQISVIGIQEQLRGLTDGSGTTQITDSLKGLDNATDDEILFEGDLKAVVDTLEDAVIASNNTIKPDTETEHHDEMNNYLKVCSNALDERNQESWDVTIELEDYGANEVTFVVEKYLKIKSNQLSDQLSAPFEKVFEQKNIFAEVGRKSGKAITFPDKAKPVPGWIEGSGSSIYVPEQSLKDLPVVLYDGTYYRDLYTKVVRKLVQNGQIEDFAETLEFNAAIIGCNVQGLSDELDPPVVINFKLNNTNSSNPVCVFWDHQTKVWSKEGCFLDDFSREDEVTCKCNHLTNFAVLMSPGKASPADILALSIISAVGCAISMFCLLVTVVIHLSLWRIVKSDRAIILLNLCIALLIGYALFLGGVSQAAEKDLCTAVAILLHYIFLVVFFLMLAEGIDIGVSIVYVFATKSRIKWLLPLAWLIPAVIVAISLGVTKTEGYGNETFCWLSIESGLIYAFVGPAAFVILFNFIIIIIVFRKMFTSSAMLTKSDKEKAKTSLRSLCVLLPILGLTWVFGVFSVNKDLVAFQYIFAICNSLQGFFIFLFHCFLNKQLRDALTLRRARKKSLQSFEKSYKNQHSTGTGSTTYHSSVDNTKGINNDLEPAIKSSSSNPFLEADRQMKELVSKGKKTGNTFDKDADTKNKVDKDKPPVDVALEDVKISNILRESEVMGGTAGISSILTTQPNAERTQRDDERQEDDKKNLRESKASSHAYDYALEPAYRTDGGQAKPAGYEKLLPQQSRSTGYDRIVRSDDNMTGLYYGGKDSGSRGRGMTDSRERIDEGREQRSTSSGRSDEDYEANVPHDVGASLPKKYDPKQAKKVEPPKKGVVSGKPKIAEGGAVKKLSSKKKKEMERDRSRLYQYQYPYDSAYLGQQSRHSSLENMSTHYVNPEYNPYAGMHPQGYTGRPTHQHQHQHQHQQWNPYGWGNQQRRDYW